MKELTLLGSALVLAGTAQAQARSSSNDLAAWYGIMVTPVGAFTPMASGTAGRIDRPELALRAARWKLPSSSITQNNLGLTYLASPSAEARYSATVGWNQPTGTGAEAGTIMLGADAASAFWTGGATTAPGSSFSVGWKASFGFGHSSEGGGIEYWSLVGQVPFEWSHQTASRSALSAFASAGFGGAGTTDAADGESGMRPMFSLGAAWASASGVAVHLGTQKVLLETAAGDGPPWVTGLSVSFPFGKRK